MTLNTERKRHTLNFSGQGRTRQEFRDETNINTVLAKWRKTGQLPADHGNAFFGDFSGPTELQEAITHVFEANQAFYQLPAEVRSLCSNSAVRFLEIFQSEDGRKKLEEAGLKLTDDETPAELLTQIRDQSSPGGEGGAPASPTEPPGDDTPASTG